MDRNAPTSCTDRTHIESLDNSRAVISYINSLNSSLLRPILTPRFAITCTEDLLCGLGNLSAENPPNGSLPLTSSPHKMHHPRPSRLPIQTHVAENPSEVLMTASLFPAHTSYTAIYEDCGLLGPSTILAHGCHLSGEEIALIKKSGAGISHCPTSNFNISSGVARVGEWIDEGVKVSISHLFPDSRDVDSWFVYARWA